MKVLEIVDKVLDLVVGVGRFVIHFVKSFYNYFFAGVVRSFSHDVQKKLETMAPAQIPGNTGTTKPMGTTKPSGTAKPGAK